MAVIAILLYKINGYRKQIKTALEAFKGESLSDSRIVDSVLSIVVEIINTTAIGGSNMAHLEKRLKKHFCYKQSNLESVVKYLPPLVNVHCHGLISYLKHKCPALSEKEIVFCTLVALGLSPGCISMVFGYDSTNSVYNKSSKIRRKLGIKREIDIYAYMADRVERLKEERQNIVDECIAETSFGKLMETLEN